MNLVSLDVSLKFYVSSSLLTQTVEGHSKDAQESYTQQKILNRKNSNCLWPLKFVIKGWVVQKLIEYCLITSKPGVLSLALYKIRQSDTKLQSEYVENRDRWIRSLRPLATEKVRGQPKIT